MGSAKRLIICTLIALVVSAATARTQGSREARMDSAAAIISPIAVCGRRQPTRRGGGLL